jgi:hypothetical protein
MMLDEKRAAIPEVLGFDVAIDELAIAGAAVGIGTAACGLGTSE